MKSVTSASNVDLSSENVGSEPKDLKSRDKEGGESDVGLLWHCLPLALLETHGLDTLPTCSHSSQLEGRKWAQRREVMRERWGELERGVDEAAWPVMKGGKERMVGGAKDRGRCGGEDKGEVGWQPDSPEGPVVVLEELRPDVGEEEVWLTGGEGLVAGISAWLGGNESVSVTSSSNGSGWGEREERGGGVGGHLMKMIHVLYV